jgi:hypothetical protein
MTVLITGDNSGVTVQGISFSGPAFEAASKTCGFMSGGSRLGRRRLRLRLPLSDGMGYAGRIGASPTTSGNGTTPRRPRRWPLRSDISRLVAAYNDAVA